ncbi:hypothetical protein PG993_004638 [Apiospora rasikravindrae]|uniref:Uncharacterized protein n=1 Tax=Apiospora rasikravindrae TaxID=990691 RepID=A0ABR1TFV4_9PEZI
MPVVDLGAIEGHDESGSEDTLEQDDDHSMLQSETENDGHYYDYLAESGSSANQDDNSAMAMSGIQHGHHDPYEVPESPDRGDHGETTANSQQSRRDAEILDAQLAGEVNGAKGQGSGQANAEDMDIDSDVDFEVESHPDLGDDKMSLQERFAQDVERFHFRSRPGDFEDSLLFEPAETTSSTTIHLSSENVETIRKIIKRKGWVGQAKDADGKFLDWETKLHNDWKRKLQNHSESVTAVGNHLCGYAEKVERLVQLAFMAPSQEKRNQMFREHIGFLEHCFFMLEKCIVFIHDQRLPFLKKQGSSSKSTEKLEVMIEEMANFHIPTLFRLLTRIWAPCSKNERRSSFDSFAIQLLARVVGWIEQLYRPFIREVREMEDSASLKNTRKEFETPMEQLREQLAQAPELLEQEEKSQATKKAHRQEQLRKQLKKQRERELQMQQEEDERVEARRRQNQEVARFLRQAHERSFKAGRRQNEDALSHQERPRRKRDASQQVHSSPAAIGVEETVWREEENLVLILKLQDSFSTPNPRLPDLYDTATRIGHTPDETVDKAREVLLAMVSRGSKGSLSEEEVHNRVQIIMRQWE